MRSPKTTRKLSCSKGSKIQVAACLILGAILLLCPTDKSISSAESIPDWLATANRIDLGHFGDGAAAVIVGNWNDFTVDGSGKFVLTERRAMRVLNRRSAERFLRAVGFETTESRFHSDLGNRFVRTRHSIGEKDVVTEAGFAGFEVFSDDRVKLIEIPGAEDGSLVGFEVVSQGRIPINGEKFRMEEEIPVLQGELHVSVPAASLRWFVNHPDRIEVVSQSSNGATFRTANRPGLPDEPSAAGFAAVLFAGRRSSSQRRFEGPVGAAVLGRSGTNLSRAL